MSSSNRKKLSEKEQEILNRQRLLAASRKQQQQQHSSSSSHAHRPNPPPPPLSSTTVGRSKPPPPPGPPPSHHRNNNKNDNASTITTTTTRISKKRKLIDLSSPTSSKEVVIVSSSSLKEVIDLTESSSPPPSPKIITKVTKRPTIRKMSSTIASNRNVEDVIAASRSRIIAKQQQQQEHQQSKQKHQTLKKGLSSLLTQAGITDQELKHKIGESKKRKHTIKNKSKNHYNYNINNINNNDDDDSDDNHGQSFLNIDDYFDNILQWDFLYDFNLERQNYVGKKRNPNHDDNSNNDNNNNKEKQEEKEREPIPNVFTSRKQYQKLWAPLCLDEARAQILSDALSDVSQWNKNNDGGYGRNSSSYNNYGSSSSFNNKRRGGDSVSLIPVLASPQSKDVGSNRQNMTIILQPQYSDVKHDISFMANDLVVLAKDKSTFIQASKGILQSSSLHSHNEKKNISGCMGVVEFGRKSLEALPIKVAREFWLQLSTGKKEERLVLLKLGGNVTNLREFSALCRIGSLPLLPYLLCKKINKTKDSFELLSETLMADHSIPKDNKLVHLQSMGGKDELGEGFITYAKNKFNTSQLGAISAAATEYGCGGFTLVKGPPGTGKTTTLVALLNALHIRQMNKYYEKVKEIVNTNNTSTGAKRLALEEANKDIPRMLVCAPSNNAIDNVILKIMDSGFIDGHGSRYYPSIIRIGTGQSVTVKDVSLETKVENLMDEAKDVSKIQNMSAAYKAELSNIQSNIGKLKRRQFALLNASPWPLSKDWEIRCDANFEETNRVYFVNHKEKTTTFEVPPPPEPGENHFHARSMPEYRTATQQLVKLVHKFSSVKTKLDRAVLLQNVTSNLGSRGKGQKNIDNIKQQIETNLLDSTHIVLTTLGTAGCRALEAAAKFEVVIIDEAAQSVEPSTLVALQLGSSHAILVGDPQQLPATVFAMSGRNTKYDRSLFQRLEEAGHEVHLLNTQYRMHPGISEFPRKIFYDGYLKDGTNVRSSNFGEPLHSAVMSKFPAFRPFTIFDVDSSEERDGASLANTTEATFALHLYNNLENKLGHLASQLRICIITPYAQQAALLRRIFSTDLGSEFERRVEINTIDSFQGREAKVIIFSCVRAAGSKGIGFLNDVRRMNVALTRAKHYLFVIARCKSITVNPYWNELVSHAYEKRAIIEVPLQGRYTFPELSTLKCIEPDPKEMIPISKRQETKNNEATHTCVTKEDVEDGEITL